MPNDATTALEFPALFVDTASSLVVVGLQTRAGDDAAEWRMSRDEAGVALFRLADELLRDAGLTIADLRTVVFCEGPGSLLGIRLAAIAVRTWLALPRPAVVPPLRVLAYRSLVLVAADALMQGEALPFHVIADARRATWNVLTVSTSAADMANAPIRRWSANELLPPACAVLHPAEFPHWQPLPDAARAIPYRPQFLPRLVAGHPTLLHAVDQPDAFLTEMPEYRTWNATPSSVPR